jgi:hypothetical protein
MNPLPHVTFKPDVSAVIFYNSEAEVKIYRLCLRRQSQFIIDQNLKF